MSSVLRQRPALRVIRGTTNGGKLIDAATSVGASVVVVARRNPSDLEAVDPDLANAARISVVAIALDGTLACLHALEPTGERFEDVSAEQLLAAISGAAPKGRA